MALYRFLFAPVLLAVAVLTTSPRRAPQPQHAPLFKPQAAEAPAMSAPAHAPVRTSRVGPSHPGSGR